jgi:hypothetical protein
VEPPLGSLFPTSPVLFPTPCFQHYHSCSHYALSTQVLFPGQLGKFFLIYDIVIHKLEGGQPFMSMSPSILTPGGTSDVASGYFPSVGTLTCGAFSFLGGI